LAIDGSQAVAGEHFDVVSVFENECVACKASV